MQTRENIAEATIRRIRALVPSGVSATDYLTAMVDEALESSQTARVPMGIVLGMSQDKALASARKTAENVESIARVCARPEGIVDLGTIEWLLRPALPLVGGEFTSLTHGPWKDLKHGFSKSLSECVCRINAIIDGFAPLHLGTGFVIGRDHRSRTAILTNAHVVEAAQLRFGWPRLAGVILEADFTCEIGASASVKARLEEEVRIHEKHDAALLMLHETGATTSCFPKLQQNAPNNVVGARIGVIGHPSFDSNIDPFPRIFGFGEAFGIKRFSPGLFRTLEERKWRSHDVVVALHDATTLSGSSGSCMFDLESLAVCGLHFGGWPQDARQVQVSGQLSLADLFEANGAVPIWGLRGDEFLADVEVVWS